MLSPDDLRSRSPSRADQGGAVYPEDTVVRIEGSTTGGVMLRVGWIGIGFRLELSNSAAGRVLTSAFKSIEPELLPEDREATVASTG